MRRVLVVRIWACVDFAPCLQVRGEVGGDLVYDEQVVYHDDAIRPAFLIMYEERDSEFEGTGV